MKKITLLIIPLLALTFAFGAFLAVYKKPEKCLETFADFKTVPSGEMLDAFYSVLQAPAEQNPDTYPVRKIGSILYGEKSALVIVHYYKSLEDTSFEYAQAFNYNLETKKVQAIEPEAPSTDDKRMYLPNVVEVTCGMQMKVTFASCDACENATGYTAIAKYFPDDGKWDYAGPAFTEIATEETSAQPPANPTEPGAAAEETAASGSAPATAPAPAATPETSGKAPKK